MAKFPLAKVYSCIFDTQRIHVWFVYLHEIYHSQGSYGIYRVPVLACHNPSKNQPSGDIHRSFDHNYVTTTMIFGSFPHHFWAPNHSWTVTCRVFSGIFTDPSSEIWLRDIPKNLNSCAILMAEFFSYNVHGVNLQTSWQHIMNLFVVLGRHSKVQAKCFGNCTCPTESKPWRTRLTESRTAGFSMLTQNMTLLCLKNQFV